ncbi:hypothetical protein [Priestia endophytica]|uniref:hypothetical protein n=1 Tax=Priestia endophytica TaxID=135735 RepID=UPI00227FA910|nr:hypothetical protein [Priestia endophytica]MCY8232347.1 hypothetical protein [Priestia endophytica]
MKKLSLFACVTALSLILSACGSNEDASTNESSDKKEETTVADQKDVNNKEDNEKDSAVKEESKEETKEKSEDGWKVKEGLGKAKDYGYGYNDEAGIDGTDTPSKPIAFGPVNLYIENMTVADIKPEESMKAMFNDLDKVRAVIVTMKAENTSDQDITFDPNQAVLVTDTGEQIESEMIMMGEVGGDFLGKVKKEGQAWWLIKDNTKDIKNIKMVIPSPYETDSLEDIAQEKRLDFEILNPEDAKKRDEK